MAMVEQIKNNTWCLKGNECIPFYHINEKDIILLDSGYLNPDGDIIKKELIDKGLNIKAVISSHSHVDHCGNNTWIQQECGAELVTNYIEDAITASPTMLSSIYRFVSPSEMLGKFPNLVMKADKVFYPDDTFVEVCGVQFKLYYLPGHTAGQTGIETPDGVIYLGDALVSDRVLEKAKLLTIMNWEEDAKSKEALRKIKCGHYVLAHYGVYTDIQELLDKNEKKKSDIADFVIDVLKTKESWNHSEIEQAVWRAFDLHSKTFEKHIIYRRNISTCIDYLVDRGRISKNFADGTFIYSVK